MSIATISTHVLQVSVSTIASAALAYAFRGDMDGKKIH